MNSLELRANMPLHPFLKEGAAGVVSVSYVVPPGEVHIIQDAVIYHDDDHGPHDLSVNVSDGVSTYALSVATAALHNVRYRLSAVMAMPLVLNPVTPLGGYCGAIDAGHKLHLDVLSYQLRGIPTWVND